MLVIGPREGGWAPLDVAALPSSPQWHRELLRPSHIVDHSPLSFGPGLSQDSPQQGFPNPSCTVALG